MQHISICIIGHIQCYYVHITNTVSFSLELVEESLIRDYHDDGPGQESQSNVETT